MRRLLATCVALALMPGTGAVHAQEAVGTQTVITPDTLPSLGTGTTAITEGAVTTIGGGVRAGDNLFHSFARFSLSAGEVARWTANDAITIRNVINRVTGGAPSFIGGTIDASAMPGADFYFINPAGIIFGDQARVDTGGMAHFATAHQLGFADGTVLVSGTGTGSTFSMAQPQRFGFLGNNQPILASGGPPAEDGIARGISVNRLTLSAGDITVADTRVAGQSITLRAVGQGAADLSVDGTGSQAPRGGRIDLLGATLFADLDGRIDLSAGNILIAGRSDVSVFARQSASPAIRIAADTLDIDGGEVRVSGIPGVAAPGGDLAIDARQVIVRDFGAIVTESSIEGGGGTIRLNADYLLLDGGEIEARGLSAPGRSVGDIQVRARLMEMRNFGSVNTTLSDFTGAPSGTTGNITLDLGRLEMDGTSTILAENQAFNASGPGSITIRADSMKITLGRISTRTETATAAGPIDVTVAGLLELDGFGGIQSISQGLGDAGSITIRAGSIRMIDTMGGPTISSQTELPRFQEFTRLSDYTGSAGRIVIQTDSLEMIGRSTITTSSSSLGDAGDIIIGARRISLAGEARIVSSADALLVPPSREDIAANPDLELVLREVPGPGKAGRIVLSAADALTMNGGTISTATGGFGAAGAVTVVADRIVLGQGSRISSDAGDLAPGQAGTVVLMGREIALADGAEVTTGSANVITAGGVTLMAQDSISITGTGSRVASVNTAAGGGAAGNITVSAPRITVGPGGLITTSSLAGAAGQIDLLLPDTGILRVAGGANPAAIATSSGPGTGGRITISRPYALIADGARIEALGQQRGANVQLATDFFIRSADNANLLLVDGDLVVDSQVGNVSSGIDTPDISFGDAAGVLAGQCRAARSSGSVSRLAIDQVGPLALGDGAGAGGTPAGGCR